MRLTPTSRLSPLAAWLILSGAVATLFPRTIEQTQLILAAAMLLSIFWLPGRRYRSAPFLFLFALVALLALNVRIPLPISWHPLLKLLLRLLIWAALLNIIISSLIAYLLRTAHHDRSPGPTA
ncbi:MAG: hypothetical protein HY372_02220 [Candidatus Andersenbacteria bacterium]|nr:hypothetical protein [Candidatus Andersenbacteria bacterium]